MLIRAALGLRSSSAVPVAAPAVTSRQVVVPVVRSQPASVTSMARVDIPRSVSASMRQVSSPVFAVSQHRLAAPYSLMLSAAYNQQRHHYSTYSSGPEMYNSAEKNGSFSQLSNICTTLLIALGAIIYGYIVYKDNEPTEVIDKSVLRDERYENAEMFVIDAMSLKAFNHEVTSGRSRGHMVRVKIKDAPKDSPREYYYHKTPFGRTMYMNELILGALARDLFKLTDRKFPKVYAVERPLMDLDNYSEYSFISESVGGYHNNNLEALIINNQDGEFSADQFKNLGVVVAFNMLFGNSDCKLANIVYCSYDRPYCYAIDHEKAFTDRTALLDTAKNGLEFIGEFKPKSHAEHTREFNSDGMLDTDDNFRQPIKSKRELKERLRPALLAAIQADIDSGKVNEFYRSFAAMNEHQLRSLIYRFGSLVHDDEREFFVSAIQSRQALVREHLALEAAVANRDDQANTVAARALR